MASEKKNKRFKIEPMLGGLALPLLLAGCAWVLRPFMTALFWAIILSIRSDTHFNKTGMTLLALSPFDKPALNHDDHTGFEPPFHIT